MIEPKIPYRLGLDVGATSVGWAALALDADGDACGILDLGSRIFPDGRAPETRGGPGASLAVGRRLARGQRRRRRRYLRRRDVLLNALADYGLMPGKAKTKTRKGLARLDPYALRKRALSGEPLRPHELGRALFHLNQRRGFKSNRKAGGGEDKKKATQARLDREGLRDALGDRQLGEFLGDRRKRREPVRARPGQELYPGRAMYEDEFDKILELQEKHHKLTCAQWGKLKRIIFHQRPLRPVEPGWCAFEENERRAPRAHPDAQEFRILEEVNNLRLRLGRGEERPLNEEERERAWKRLRMGKDIEFKKPTQDIGLPEGAAFNLARGGRKKLKGNAIAAAIMESLRPPKRKGEKAKRDDKAEKWWSGLSDEKQREIQLLLSDTDDAKAVVAKAKERGLDDDLAGRLEECELPAGYVRLSLKAIRKVLPHLRRGLLYNEAVVAAGYPHHSDERNDEAHDRLPYYGVVLERHVVGADPSAPESDEVKRWGRFPNPTVHVGLNQIRRVVNLLIKVYGKPEEIVVELVRELKMNKDQRKAQREAQQEGEERNARYAEMLQRAPSPRERLRLRLWEEQGKVCVYTGEQITLDMVVPKETNETEIDHILPFSRTLDNGRGNMVLCLRSANQSKGDKTPFEAFSDEESGYDYEAILTRADALPGKRGWRFRDGAMERFEKDDRFLDRHLSETAYLSRTARRYLAYLYNEKGEDDEKGEVRVRAIPGRLTALLRDGWELGKSRKDHRHHAVDAFVVANTTQGMLQRFEKASGAMIPYPWPGFRSEFNAKFKNVIVSYKPDHGSRDPKSRKTTGQLHKDTAYGLIGTPGDGPVEVVVRKPLKDFKQKKELDAARDPILREALKALWDETGGNRKKEDGDDSPTFAAKARGEGVLLNGKRHFPRSIRILDKLDTLPFKDDSGEAYKGYVRGGNAFADVWGVPAGKNQDGKKRKAEWMIVVVPTFDFNQKGFDDRLHLQESKPHPAAKYLTRIRQDDMAALGEGEERRIVRVRKITGGKSPSIVLDPHHEANVAKRASDKSDPMKANAYRASKLMNDKFRKVAVDEIGRLRDPGPFREAAPAAPQGEPAKRKKAAKPGPAEAKPLQPSLL